MVIQSGRENGGNEQKKILYLKRSIVDDKLEGIYNQDVEFKHSRCLKGLRHLSVFSRVVSGGKDDRVKEH